MAVVRFKPPEHGLAVRDGHQWLVFGSSLVCMVLPMGYFYSMGRTFVAVLDTFHTSRARAAVIQSTTIGVFMAAGVVTGGLIQKFGTRACGIAGSVIFCGGLLASFFATSETFLVVSQGIIVGFGLSLIYICCYTVVGQTFVGRSSLVGLSCVALASGVGGMIFPYILELLIHEYGIRGTYLIISGVNMNCLALSLLWPSSVQNQTGPGHKKTSLIASLRHLIKNTPFVLFTIGIAVVNPALSIFLIFMADTILDSGFTQSDASLGLLLLSITSMLGRPVPVLLKQLPGVSSLCVPLMAAGVGLLGLLIMVFVRQVLGLILLACCLTGLSMGVTIPCYSIVSVRLVGAELLPTAFGFLFTITAVGNITAPPLSGILRDKTDSYVLVYIVAAAAMALGGFFFLLAQIVRMRYTQEKHGHSGVTSPALLQTQEKHIEPL